MQKSAISATTASRKNSVNPRTAVLSNKSEKLNRSPSPQKVKEDKVQTPKAPKEKKDITNISTWEPTDFTYNKIIGEGAFGIVRKCELTYEAANSSTSEGSEDDEKTKKFVDKDQRQMAVKIQSKYQLIKNKQ